MIAFMLITAVFRPAASVVLLEPVVTFHACKGIQGVCDRLDAPGVVAYTNESATLFSSNSEKREKTFELAKGTVPAFYEKTGLALVRPWMPGLEHYNAPALRAMPTAQSGALLCLTPGLAVFTRQSVFSVPEFTGWSGVGVRFDQVEIAILQRPMSAPFIERFRFDGDQWVKFGGAITPEIPGVGLVGIVPGFNTMRYISGDKVVFVGALWPTLSAELSRKIYPLMPDVLELGEVKGKSAGRTAYLFCLDLRDRSTHVICKVLVDPIGEGYGVGMDKLSVSSDQQSVFLRAREGFYEVAVSGSF